MRGITAFILALTSGVALTAGFAAADATGPTPQSALAADARIQHALAVNDTKTLHNLLATDWIVVSANGGWDGRDDILQAIDAGIWTHTMDAISKPRVRVYGTSAVVTTHAAVSGMFQHKPYNIQECQTDFLVWSDGAWKSELLHESPSKVPNSNC